MNNLFNCHTSTFNVSKLDSLLDFINFCMTCTGLNAPNKWMLMITHLSCWFYTLLIIMRMSLPLRKCTGQYLNVFLKCSSNSFSNFSGSSKTSKSGANYLDATQSDVYKIQQKSLSTGLYYSLVSQWPFSVSCGHLCPAECQDVNILLPCFVNFHSYRRTFCPVCSSH